MISRFFLFSACVFIAVACQKEDNLEPEIRYSFAPLCVALEPSNTITTTDTFWVESKVPGFLVDETSNEKVYFVDALMNVNFLVRAWSSNAERNTSNSISLVYETYCQYNISVDYARMSGLVYQHKDTSYHLKVGVVFHEPGIYSADFDYITFFNHNSNSNETYGGGRITFLDVDYAEYDGYLNPFFDASNQADAYSLLTENEKKRFMPVDSSNAKKYYFVNVVSNEK